MADAGDSKSPAPRGLEGSTPSSGTKDQPKDSERLLQIPTQPTANTEPLAHTTSTYEEGSRTSFLTGSQTERRQPPLDEEIPPPVTLGPYRIAYLGRRGGLKALRINVGQHTLDLFATPAGRAASVSAEIDGWKLCRRRKPRLWRRWSNDLSVKRWVLAAAAETDDGAPRWSCKEIARNLKRARRGEMTGEAVRRLIWRLSPALAEQRAYYWRVEQHKPRKRVTTKPKHATTRTAEREAVVDVLKRAGLL